MVDIEAVLQHETRRMIYQHILAHPGVTFNILKDVFGLTDGTLRYHIDYLKRADKISNNLTEGKRVYYPNGIGNVLMQKSKRSTDKFKLNDIQERLMETIRRYPGINQKELSDRCNLNRFKVRNNIGKLIDFGLIRTVKYKNMVCYEYVTDGHMEYEVLKTLIMKLLKGEIDEQTFIELKRKIEEDSN